MRGFIMNVLGFLLAGKDQDLVQVTTTGGSAALFLSLVDLDNVDPVTGRVPADNVVRSGNLVTIRSREGIYLTAEPAPGGPGKVLMSAYRGNETARMGSDVFRIYRVGGNPGDPIRGGDRFRLVLAPEVPLPGVAETEWLTNGNPVRRPFFFATSLEQTAGDAYTWIDEQLHLADFQVPEAAVWPHQRGSLSTRVTIAGPDGATLPGGFAVRVSGTPISNQPVIAIAPGAVGTHEVQLFLDAHAGTRTPCEGPAPQTIAAESVVRDDERFEREVAFGIEPSAHLTLTLVMVARPAGCLGGVTGILPWRLPVSCLAQLERRPEPAGSTPPVMDVALQTDQPRITGLTQLGTTAAAGEPLRFSFELSPGRPGEKGCATLVATYTEANRPHTARFGLRISGDAVTVA